MARTRPDRPTAGEPATAASPKAERLEVTLVDHTLLGHHLAKQTGGTEEENEHQHREGEDVAVLGADGAAGHDRQQPGAEGLEQAKSKATEHRSGNAADAAENGRG